MKATFEQVDEQIDLAFDRRERYDDDELDAISMRCAYLDAIEKNGWTQAEYEYLYRRYDPTYNPKAATQAQENDNDDSDYDEERTLDDSEAGGQEVGTGEGF